MRQCMRLALCLTVLICLSGHAMAALPVLASQAAAGLLEGDQILALRSVDADKHSEEWPATDPLSLALDMNRCMARTRCRVAVLRAGATLEIPLWIDTVLLAPARPTNELQRLRTLLVDAPDAAAFNEMQELAQTWFAQGEPRQAAWLLLETATRQACPSASSGALALEQRASEWLHDEPDLTAMWALGLTGALLACGELDLGAARLDSLLQTQLPLPLQVYSTRMRTSVDFARSQLAQAEQRLRPWVDLARRQAPHSHLLAATLNSLAVVIRPQGRLTEARGLFQEALSVAEAFESGSVTVAKIRSNLGLLERAAGDLVLAESELRQALSAFERLAQSELVFDTRSNLALVLIDRGRTREAASLLNQEVPAGSSAAQRVRAGRVQLNLAIVFANQGDSAEAVRRTRLALEHFRDLPDTAREHADALTDLGLYLSQTGDFAGARIALQKALALHQRAAPDGIGVILGYDTLASVEYLAGDFAAALKAQNQALTLRDAGEHGEWRRDRALTQLGNILTGLNRPRAALPVLRQAAALASTNGRDLNLALAQAAIGDAQLLLRRPGAARRSACAGVDRVEALRGSAPAGPEFRARLVEVVAPMFQSCMDALIADHDIPAALSIYQRERLLILGELIADRDLHFADLPAALATRRRSALQELGQIADQLEQSVDAKTRPALLETREHVRMRLRRIDDDIASALPSLSAWQPRRAPVPSHAPGNSLVLAFAVRAEDTLRFSLSPDAAPRIERLGHGREELSRAVQAWRQALLTHQVTAERKLARQLHQWLLDGAELPAGTRMIVVPDGPLHALPFSALLDANGRRLIEQHAVALTALLPEHEPDQRVDAAIDLLVFAGAKGDEGGGQHPALPGVDLELEALARLPYPHTRLLRDTQARAEALHREGPAARILHFAVHGIVDPASPLDSALLLSDGAHGLQPLPVWEIFEGLRLDADLVVLAACDSAPGAVYKDEGWLGLTRAFQFAGARRVVSALWPVSDAATAQLMNDFHQRLAGGTDAVTALALAQRSLMRARIPGEGARRGVGGLLAHDSNAPVDDDPVFWAGFQIYLTEPRTLESKQ
jgi:CHAT domain-containing protein/Flp pilus assembly protein TadD